eukprot:357286-Chlamydomonas_euryale.AAC.8
MEGGVQQAWRVRQQAPGQTTRKWREGYDSHGVCANRHQRRQQGNGGRGATAMAGAPTGTRAD